MPCEKGTALAQWSYTSRRSKEVNHSDFVSEQTVRCHKPETTSADLSTPAQKCYWVFTERRGMKNSRTGTVQVNGRRSHIARSQCSCTLASCMRVCRKWEAFRFWNYFVRSVRTHSRHLANTYFAPLKGAFLWWYSFVQGPSKHLVDKWLEKSRDECKEQYPKLNNIIKSSLTMT